jgi:photosystem I P700 chlorophyll a apoprotein A2
MTGAFVHGAVFFIRDYNPEHNKNNVLARMLEHKEAIVSHLSWASLFLGFHTLGLYVHNDVMLAFGTLEIFLLLNLYLFNGSNLFMVKLYTVSTCSYFQ